MAKKLRVAIVAATARNSVETRVAENCARDLRRSGASVAFVARKASRGGWWWAAVKAIVKSDVAIFHSPLIFSLSLVVWAKLLGKNTVSLVWDVYPVRLNGRRYDPRLSRRVVDRLERLGLHCSDLILVPSLDFLKDNSLAGGEFEPMWVETRRAGDQAGRSAPFPHLTSGRPLQILFAGQVNATRGLDSALEKLEHALPVPFVVRVASFSKLPAKVLSHPRVACLGGIDPVALGEAAAECHFGLVSLSPGLEGAGFPSKTFDYLAFGLPILYFGPRLAHFTSLLEGTGVGLDITAAREISRDRLLALSAGLEESRLRFISETALQPGRLAQRLARFGPSP